ncbi:GntR family transcriptional regulator [Novosphingobium sp. KACC 22771]|uniref:GntR family transcriptional regulator n=1 Tax=Novosphingobium sp. KACC 22771 TaxID=3025670 RepID=UPI002365AE62|nr:GntR family transcriptional regulator [Novosphingobium sp. KACC 22771]WDF74230.1 GntR family transcriptional regulator [Novosphingobium sp. KACC 22771]
MAPRPVAAERAYGLLKADVLSGRFAPGSVVIERIMAEEYGVSVSPFRDAAQRLVGEAFLEIGAGGGYQVPSMNAEVLRDLYHWHSHLVRLILKAQQPLPAGAYSPATMSSLEADHLPVAFTNCFRSLAGAASNREYARALRQATDRLFVARLHEGAVLANLANELEMVEAATASGSGLDRYDILWAYHRRRIRRVTRIAELINAGKSR